tara:strand:+ start:238 stop:567 length:330 start_codon:yes stop_codon:yes gene_type:complete
MPTTWTSESNTTSGWTTSGGTNIQTNSVVNNFNDGDILTFGSDMDYGLGFDATDNRLEFVNPNNQTVASIGLTGLYLEQVNFIELDSLPNTAVKGRMLMYNNEYYLGVE